MTTTHISALSDTSRVWMYQNEAGIPAETITAIKEELASFAIQWQSHSQQMTALGDVIFDRFLVLIADESRVGAGGCSIDSSVHFFKALEQKYGLNLMDRMLFSYRDGENINTLPREEFAKLYAEGTIDDKTIVFDTLVKTKADLESSFEKALGESWHKRMV